MGFDRQRASALRQIKAKNVTATFSRKAGAAVKDPVTQAVTTAAADGVWTRYVIGLPAGRSWAFRNATLVLTGMEELHVAPEGFVPSPGDSVRWKGGAWKVVDVVDYDPDGSGSLYFRALISR